MSTGYSPDKMLCGSRKKSRMCDINLVDFLYAVSSSMIETCSVVSTVKLLNSSRRLKRTVFCSSVSDGASAVCVSLCSVNDILQENPSPQRSHSNGIFSVCLAKCSFKWPFWLKRLPQWVHLKGLFPVCVLLCCSRPPTCEISGHPKGMEKLPLNAGSTEEG